MRLPAVSTVIVPVNGPFSLTKTLSKKTRFGADWYGLSPFETFQDGAYYGALSLDGLPEVGLKIEPPRNQRVTLRLFTEVRLSSALERHLAGSVVRWLTLWEDVSPFYRLARAHPAVREAVANNYGMRETRCINLFETIAFCIALQRATGGRTLAIMKGLCEELGTRLEFAGTEITSFPRAEVVAALEEQALRASIPLGYRARYLIGNARVIQQLPVDGALVEGLDREVRRQFLATYMTGLGPYSAEILDPAGIPLDSWSASAIGKLIGIRTKGYAAAAVERWLRTKFGAWARLAFVYLANEAVDGHA